MPANSPGLADLYRLMAQLELDQDAPVQALRERDHAIGEACDSPDDSGRLLFWLQQVAPANGDHRDPLLGEAASAHLARLVAFVLGSVGMASFLFGSGRGLVNVFTFLLLFVLVQLLLCMVSSAVLVSTVRGNQPLVLPVNPARFIVARMLPDRRYWREAQSVLRLVLLRYGQELGAVFTLGAVAAFFVVLGLADFSFVWGSTFSISDGLVERLAALVAAPWSTFLPAATVTGQVIADSRFHPAVTDLSMANVGNMRLWWPFLITAMATYALLPRLLLWGISRFLYARKLRATFTGLPGSKLVLARMRSALVSTQGEATGPASLTLAAAQVEADQRLLLVNWSNALGPGDAGQFEALFAVPDRNIVNAGLGSLPEELGSATNRLRPEMEQLYVAVKSWEPPMADLADFLAHFERFARCTVFLVPLGHRAISADKLDDWRQFARALPFAEVDVQRLERS